MKTITNLLLGALTFLAVASCSDDDKVSPSSENKEYSVEYKITSTTGSACDFVLYYNETGGQTQLTSATLPATYTFKRTMKRGDISSVSASVKGGTATAEVTTAVLLDGKQVATSTARGEGQVATATFIIGQ